MTQAILILFILLIAAGQSNEGKIRSCSIVINGQQYPFDCWKAEFSSFTAKHLYAKLVFEPEGLCDALQSQSCPENHQGYDFLALTSRGQCSFAAKADEAAARGYVALLVANTQDSMFSIGSANASYRSPVPVFSVQGSVLAPFLIAREGEDSEGQRSSEERWREAVALLLRHNEVHISIRTKLDEQARQRLLQEQEEYMGRLLSLFRAGKHLVRGGVFLLALCLAPFVHLAEEPGGMAKKEREQSPARRCFGMLVPCLAWGVLLLVFVLSRLATMRRVGYAQGSAQLEHVDSLMKDFNHRETDERVYESLIASIITNPYQYRLPKDTLHLLSLSKENYDHPLFVHPPLFPYLSALLSLPPLALPLPLQALLFHLLSLLLLPPMVGEVVRDTPLAPHSAALSLLSSLLFLTCPLSFFCSQKVWLDNALLLSLSLSLYLHLLLVRRGGEGGCLLSGLLFSLLPLSTKITALFALPFLCLWIVFRRAKGAGRGGRGGVLLSLSLFLLGGVVGYLPWGGLYYSKMGRLLPTAWPSPSLLSSFPFLQRALERPPWHYFTTSVALHPLYLLSLPLGLSLLSRLSSSTPSQRAAITPLLLLSLLPLSFLGGLGGLAWGGSGVQMRFLLPVLPSLCIFSSISFFSLRRKGWALGVGGLLLCAGAVHCFYSLLSSPLEGDLKGDLLDVVEHILLHKMPRRGEGAGGSAGVGEILKHFGLQLMDY